MKLSGTGFHFVTLVTLAVLALVASGCGGVHATSWTGLTVNGDRLYLADLTQVKVLNSADASVIWSFPADPRKDPRGVFYVTPVVVGEHVIAASEMPPTGMFSRYKYVIWALDREDGTLLWRFDGAAGPYVESGAPGGALYVAGNSDGKIYALDLESGTLRWSFSTGHRVWASPLIISDTVYIGSMDRHLYALNLSDGKERWRFRAGGAFAAAPALWNDTLYILSLIHISEP
ncbi:MAG: PQQ-like beta-propeller repeat protein, partial [Anaerolineae bacterium]|nr:PQQ-like beta-propeller repeat protein [Anaerolineae bacterium]